MAVTSIFSHIYLAVQQRLAAVINKEKKVRFIEHNLGQLLDEQPQLTYPAVLIDMSDATFTAIGENVQTGEVIVKLSLVLKPHSDTNNLTPTQVRETGLKFYELEHLVHTLMQGWQPSYIYENVEQMPQNVFGKFARISARTNNSRADLRVRDLSYRIAFEDYSTQHAVYYAPASPVIDFEIEAGAS